MGELFAWAALSAVSLGLLLVAEWRNSYVYRGTFKFFASTGFIGAAVVMGAFDSVYGSILLAGLVLSWMGDMFLVSHRERLFQMGLGSFLMAHIAFGVAFLVLGHDLRVSAIGLAVLAFFGAGILRWLTPALPRGMRLPVAAYLTIITVMVALAMGAFWKGADYTIVIGAVLFYFSDFFVARDRFKSDSFINELFGLPLYYAAQFLFAFSVSTV